MVDVDKLSDAELRTKLLEFGFPVMPITGTTRKVMTKKLKLLLENKNKVGSSDGRRSMGRYSSEEDSDTDIKLLKKDKNRRATMAAPVASARTLKKNPEPEVVSSSPKKRESRNTITTTTTRSQRIINSAQDNYDTGSDSESDIVASSNKYDSTSYDSPKYDDSLNEVEFRRAPVKSTFSSSYSRYSPPKSDDLSFSTSKNVSFEGSTSPARQTTYGGSLASEYASDTLNQYRTRSSVGSPSYDRPAYSSPLLSNNQEEKVETPFLSNFTRRLSAIRNSGKKTEYDSRNDLVKEHDSNGSSLYGRSYLSNFRATRGRELTYNYKNRDNGGKNNYVSYAVLAGAALFFIFLAVVYLGMRSDTSLVSSGKSNPYSKS